MLQSGQPTEDSKVYVVHSRTDHGEWKPAKFSDKKTARFLTEDDEGELELEWEAVAEQKKVA